MKDNKYFMIDNKPHKVLGIKGDRVILQSMTPIKYTGLVRNRSFKIYFSGDIGYYIVIPKGTTRIKVLMSDILKQWEIYNNIKEYNRLLKEY